MNNLFESIVHGLRLRGWSRIEAETKAFETFNPARDLALIGVEKRHAHILSTARLIREQLGLEPDPRLGS